MPVAIDIINRAYRVEEPFVIGERLDAEQARGMAAASGGAFLVAALPDAERAIGAVYIRIRDGRGYVGPLAIDPDLQGRGLGKLLVTAAEAYCCAKGCRHLDLDVLQPREELIGFYLSLGFIRLGMADYPDPGRLRSPARLVLMTKPL